MSGADAQALMAHVHELSVNDLCSYRAGDRPLSSNGAIFLFDWADYLIAGTEIRRTGSQVSGRAQVQLCIPGTFHLDASLVNAEH